MKVYRIFRSRCQKPTIGPPIAIECLSPEPRRRYTAAPTQPHRRDEYQWKISKPILSRARYLKDEGRFNVPPSLRRQLFG